MFLHATPGMLPVSTHCLIFDEYWIGPLDDINRAILKIYYICHNAALCFISSLFLYSTVILLTYPRNYKLKKRKLLEDHYFYSARPALLILKYTTRFNNITLYQTPKLYCADVVNIQLGILSVQNTYFL